jgi:hypothetical protein
MKKYATIIAAGIKCLWLDFKDWVDPPFMYIAIAIVAFWVLLIFTLITDAKRWVEFAEAHDCKIVAHISRIGSVSSKTGYACNDGITYYR